MEETSLRLGYAFLSPPGSSHSFLGFKGYDIDAFRDFAHAIGKRLEFVKVASTAAIPHDQERSPFTGVPGAVENGSIFTYLDQNALTPIRVRAFEYILNQMVGFDLYGGKVVAATLSIHRFRSFNTSTHHSNNDGSSSTISSIRFDLSKLRRCPFSKVPQHGSSLTFFSSMVSGSFSCFTAPYSKGNTSFPPPLPTRNLEYYLSRLRSGQVDLIALHGNTVKNDDRSFLLCDPSRLLTIPDPNEIVRLLCSPRKKNLVPLSSVEFAQLPKPPNDCRLGIVDSSVLVDGKLQKYGLFSEKASVFLLPKKIRKKWMDELKWLYNTFYSIENRLGILHRRYSDGRSAEPTNPADISTPTYSPFTITRLTSVLYSFLALILFSIVVFIVELILPTSKVTRWLRMCRNGSLKAISS